ncbi:MAG: hypothetical protein OEZ06_02630 [Myxococcales bacterium]|nr:hypothetical protein [Myxococcales bacterium]
MKRPKLYWALLLSAALSMAGLAVFLPTAAEAAGGLKAQVFLVQSKIPKKLSEKGLIGFARGHRAKLLREDRSGEIKKRKWKAEMVVSFNRPVGDLEFQVLFYDIHDGPRRFVQDMSTFVNDRKQKTFVQKVTLPRPDFKPNRNMELVVTVKRQEVGRMKFGLVGEEVKRSGEVSFSDSER